MPPSGRPDPAAAPPLDAEAVGRLLDVSRETLDRLRTYLALLERWQRAINLVGPATLVDPWRRHVLDSGQLRRLCPPSTRRLVDLGSGAGLPGLILAILGVPEVHLIESDQRKASFLREAARACGASSVAVHAARIEAVPPLGADVVTARALASLPQLLALAEPQVQSGTTCLFLKGRRAEAELTAARETWTMRVAREASLSDPDGQVLIISEIRRAASRHPL
jgi:16S rRNA (guanine527-N7)-methyltransferase